MDMPPGYGRSLLVPACGGCGAGGVAGSSAASVVSVLGAR